jgi:hypothetical protein
MPSYDYSFQASFKNMAPIILEDVIATKDIPYKSVVGSFVHAMVSHINTYLLTNVPYFSIHE